jgi:GPH family glycoside/pentoside/hexuronide:cation symporter
VASPTISEQSPADGATAAAQESHQRLSTGVKLAYAGPTFALAGMAVPIFVYMSKFYADVVLVPLGYLALAIALARAFDAIADPLVGWLSDRTRTRVGRRRPYLAIGAPLCALAFFALFSPPAAFSTGAATLWFGVCFLLYFVCHTVFVIPYNALGVELTLDYHERSSLFGWRESFALIGTISAAVAPFPLIAWLSSQRAAYSLLAACYAIAMVALGGLAFLRLRERPDFATRASNPFVPGVRRALRNRPFRILLASYVVGSVTAAIPATLLPFFISYVVRPEHDVLWTAVAITSHFAAGLLSIPLWVAASKRYGKRAAWLSGFTVVILALGSAFFVGEGDVVQGVALLAIAGVAFGGQLLLTPSIQADVIDYDELHTGRRREAQYGALWALLPKLVAIPGAAIPLAILGSIGYQPNAEQAPQVVFAIRVLFALVPAAFSSAAFAIAWRFPIDERIHGRIQAGIDAHARGEVARDPLTGARLLPPGSREVDEETGWLLDHFSPGELRRVLSGGVARLRRDTALAALGSLGACAACVILASFQARDPSQQPGAIAVVAIAAAGAALAVLLFHAIRMRVARRLRSESLRPADLRAHLATLEPFRETSTEGR